MLSASVLRIVWMLRTIRFASARGSDGAQHLADGHAGGRRLWTLHWPFDQGGFGVVDQRMLARRIAKQRGRRRRRTPGPPTAKT